MSAHKTILVIDDEPDLVEMLQTLLESEGHRVLTASNGQEGLRVLDSGEKPALIVLDMNMPKMGGVAFYEELLKRSGGPKPSESVLILTARANLEDWFRSIDVDGFMTKPFDTADFLEEVRVILHRKHQAPAPESRVIRRDRHPRVLIVENEPVLFDRLVSFFASKGATVSAEKSGTTGIERARIERPDLIVAKLSLPDFSGDFVAQKLGRMPSTMDIPVVLYAPKFAGTDRVTLDQICREAGAAPAVASSDPAEIYAECERMWNRITQGS